MCCGETRKELGVLRRIAKGFVVDNNLFDEREHFTILLKTTDEMHGSDVEHKLSTEMRPRNGASCTGVN